LSSPEKPYTPSVTPPSENHEDDSLNPTKDSEAFSQEIRALYLAPLESFSTVTHLTAAWDLLESLTTSPLKEQNWAFRGHANTSWSLEPSIERLQRAYPNSVRVGAEEYVRKAFKRRAHHYLNDLPGEHEELEWMALMRHHGAPTRLLDWTRSPYVAAFFALAEAPDEQDSVIWAIDIEAIRLEASMILSKSAHFHDLQEARFPFSDPAVFERVFLRETNDPSIVAPVQPLRMNERATSQQGLYLCENSPMMGFEFGLKQVLKSDRDRFAELSLQKFPNEKALVPQRLIKLCIASSARSEMLRELHRMNINHATLFPGLDGFAKSLGTNITISGAKYIFYGEFLDSQV
jgi:hypothetical protein